MKRTTAFIAAVLALLSFAPEIAAEDQSQAVSEAAEQGMGTVEIAIIAVIMFAVIAVVGVMFFKTVQKDKQSVRGIRRK